MPYDTGLSYDDVLVVPQRSPVDSRSDVDLSTTLAPDLELAVPVTSAAMDTVTEAELARALSAEGGLGVLHRFLPIDEQAAMVREVTAAGERTAAAVGIDEDYRERAGALLDAGAAMIVVDVAHGHMERTVDAVAGLREAFSAAALCAGNVVTAEAVADLAAAGADCVKVGVGPGAFCTTREVAGAGVPQFTAIERCVPAAREQDVTVIADGGIRSSGDAVKAVLAGADAVMLGSFFAGTDEAPGGIVEVGGDRYKHGRGMATAAAAEDRADKDADVVADEGVEGLTEYRGPLADALGEFTAGLRSGLSYAGAHDLEAGRENAEFIQLANGAKARNGAHGIQLD